MEDQTPQIQPQKHRKSTAKQTANYYSEGDLNIVNNYYADDSPIIHKIDFWDLIGLAFLLLGILFLGGLAVWCLHEVGLKIIALWAWVAKNWKTVLIGFFAVSLVGGVTVWHYLTYTKDTKDTDLL
jgi:hypothetical protein